ncbi:uncharacterized protein TNIN_287851 [Trichonephila inaurata madagascariensis]|uniref:Pre-C2HC domain-containing protein n=1 Tax=Trichonephila inaurata madagascariensis TaxID=2747483 RepID=A0A8X6Y8E6_9ARAC|nr:uncharacterized protein TNIN_287851 [Trichonephila inaurata madagascariensis]
MILPKVTDEQHCLHLHGIDKEVRIFAARKDYINQMLEIENSTPSPTPETMKKLEEELSILETKIKTLEGKMTEFLPCPIAMCKHNNKIKAVERPAEPVIRPARFTAKANKNNSDAKDFVFPKKTGKNFEQEKNEHINVSNSFAVLNAANEDAEDVTQPKYKIKPIFMRLTPNYNLIHQEINRTHPSAKNTHTKGYFKIEAETEDHHREITRYLTEKKIEYYVIEPPANRPLKLVIKGLPEDVDPEDIKNDLISKGIKIEKVAQLKKFATKAKLPIFMIEVTRDENVDDIFQVRSCLFMQIKLDPFKRVIPGLTFAQVSNPNKSQQMAAQGSASSASNQTKNSNKAPENTEAINAIQSENSEFGYLQALLEIQKIFSLFPSLLSEMKKSQLHKSGR